MNRAVAFRRRNAGARRSVKGHFPDVVAEFARNVHIAGRARKDFFDLIDFVAAGNRTYVNALGHVVTAGSNVPCIGHHVYKGGKWVPVGLLLEPDGQNDVAGSEDFSNSNIWQKSAQLTITPSGTLGAFPPLKLKTAIRWCYDEMAHC